MKFRKKPVVIDATQFNQLGDHPAVVATTESPTGFGIHTLEHTAIKHEVTLGDWIITGVKGEVYACKPDIFTQTYEPVTEVAISKYIATNCSEEEFVTAGTGDTPDEAYADFVANQASDEARNTLEAPGDILEVEIWTTRPPGEDDGDDYHWMLDQKIETREYVATKEDFE